MVVYISKEEVIRTNKNLVGIYDQRHVIQQEANLDYVLDRMQHYAESSSDEEQKILKKAAYLLYHLAYASHAFFDGNKRTAMTATLYFLLSNGYVFDNSMSSPEKQDEVAKFMKDTAAGKNRISAVYRWLKLRLVKLNAI